jgi:two-component system NtrC family sensor kinase
MKKYFGLLIFLCSSFIGIAQNSLPPVYEINTDTAVAITLNDAYWQMLEDPEGKWTIDEVSQSPVADKFHANTTKINGVDHSINTFWLRYRFKNNMGHEARITIPKDVSAAVLYTRGSDGKWNHKTTGKTVPWSKRDDLKRITTVTYIMQPGEELLIYERDVFNYPINEPDFLEVNFGYTDKVIQDYYNDTDPSVFPSILFGFFLLAALFNIYFFLVVHERVYLFFSLMILGRGLPILFDNNNAFLPEHPVVKWAVGTLLWLSYFFFLIHFVRYFLQTFKYVPRWDKFLIGLSIFTIIRFILGAMNIMANEPYSAAVMFFIFITFTLFIRSTHKSVRWRVALVLPAFGILATSLFDFLFSALEKYTGIQVPTVSENWFAILEELSLVWLILFFSWSLFQRYQQLQKTIAQEALAKERLAKEKEIERSQLIEEQKVVLEKTVDERTAELKQSLYELKSTQSQLIQSEKMASLGELTAGIAHEIQNPLNFVNNFSEVNNELIEELKGQKSKLKSEEQDELLNDIFENNEKINHHGKRADAIVKGMLQHSKTSTGKKEPTDINKLADEYLRLAYHGLRAKDKLFNAKFETDFDPSVGKINIVPQDIGRVLLNLINNAFYAVNQKQKTETGKFEPCVSVQTKKVDGKIEITVKDNGNGISQKILDKIFQPFFTTKPTGEGTGLGLSLSYDIIKAHGGEIKVESKEGHGSEFIVQVPYST